jgi:hypothetical protein
LRWRRSDGRPTRPAAIATEAVSRAAPDGNTLLLVANSFVINPSLKRLSYDPFTGFEPICLLTRSPNVIVVNSTSPYRSLLDLVSAARARPGELTMAFQGPGTGQHVGFEELRRCWHLTSLYGEQVNSEQSAWYRLHRPNFSGRLADRHPRDQCEPPFIGRKFIWLSRFVGAHLAHAGARFNGSADTRSGAFTVSR